MRTSNIWHLNRSSLYAVVSDISHRDPHQTALIKLWFQDYGSGLRKCKYTITKDWHVDFWTTTRIYQGTPNPMSQLQRDFQSQFMRDVRYYNGTSLWKKVMIDEDIGWFCFFLFSVVLLLLICKGTAPLLLSEVSFKRRKIKTFWLWSTPRWRFSWWCCCWLVTMKVFVIYDESWTDGGDILLCDDEGGRRLLWLAGNPKLTEGGSKRGI